jgi:two-component system NtrC family sensor kinase
VAASILVVEKEPQSLEALKRELAEHGHELIAAAGCREAFEHIQRLDFDVVIADCGPSGANGTDVLRHTKDASPDTEVVIVTERAAIEDAVASVRGGAFDFIQRPFDLAELIRVIERAIERRQLRSARALYQASQAIFAAREPQRLPEVIVEVAMRVMAADDVSLMVPDNEQRLYILHSHGLTPEVQAEVKIALGERVAGRVARSREPVLLSGALSQDPSFSDVPSFGRVRSSIVYPLLSGERLLGVLNMSRVGSGRPFRKPDLEHASVLASQIVLALENTRLLQQLAVTERFAAVGQLAAGVAHEINNPVACVIAAHSYLQDRLEDLHRLDALVESSGAIGDARALWKDIGGRTLIADMHDALSDAEEAVGRVRDIIGDMRSLARADDVKGTLVDISEPVRSALRVAGAELRHRAVTETHLAAGLEVQGNAGRLSQVFLNLFMNASQAFGDRPLAQNRIVVSSERLDNRVVVRVSDNGPGILPQHLSRIFEPFFSTKEASKGMGLGLSISRDIARAHGGELQVESTPGRGTTFSLILPVANVHAVGVEVASQEAPGFAQRRARAAERLRLLFIDDEPAMLRAYERFFGRDYDVVVAADGRQALDILAEGGDFGAIVCDFLMPELTGMEAYRRTLESQPQLADAFVFVTAHVNDKDVRAFVDTVPNKVFEKPLDLEQLKHVIDQRAR